MRHLHSVRGIDIIVTTNASFIKSSLTPTYCLPSNPSSTSTLFSSCSNRMSQCKRHSVFQAVWARNEDFKDILVSRKMISDHCPFLIMDALEKVRWNEWMNRQVKVRRLGSLWKGTGKNGSTDRLIAELLHSG